MIARIVIEEAEVGGEAGTGITIGRIERGEAEDEIVRSAADVEIGTGIMILKEMDLQQVQRKMFNLR